MGDARNAEVKRFYYLDIQKTLDDSADLDGAILSVPHDRKLRNFRGEVIADYPTPALEYEHEMLPLNAVLDTTRYNGWQMGYLQHAGGIAINAQTYFDEVIDIHHVSPKDWLWAKVAGVRCWKRPLKI